MGQLTSFGVKDSLKREFGPWFNSSHHENTLSETPVRRGAEQKLPSLYKALLKEKTIWRQKKEVSRGQRWAVWQKKGIEKIVADAKSVRNLSQLKTHLRS